jgi:hypothetical protein
MIDSGGDRDSGLISMIAVMLQAAADGVAVMRYESEIQVELGTIGVEQRVISNHQAGQDRLVGKCPADL